MIWYDMMYEVAVKIINIKLIVFYILKMKEADESKKMKSLKFLLIQLLKKG